MTEGLQAGRQLRAARVMAGLTQRELAMQAGFSERAARWWEGRSDLPPSSVPSTIKRIVSVLRRHGVRGVFGRDEKPKC